MIKSPYKAFLSFIFIIFFGFYSFAQKSNFSNQANMIVKTAEKFHYSPRPLNDEFSAFTFDKFIELVDPTSIFLSTEDIKQLEILKLDIDNEIFSENCIIIEKTSKLLERKLLFVDSLLNTFKLMKIDLNKVDSITINDKNDFVSKKQFTENWTKIIKLQILISWVSNADSIKLLSKPTTDEINKIKNEVITREICRVKSKLNYTGGIEQFVGSSLLSAIAFTYDPHTEYFSIDEENNFSTMLSKDALSYGIEISRNEMGEIEIVGIAPGSPAWKSNLINEGDVILKVKPKNGIEKEFDCLAMDEVEKFVASTDFKEAWFYIRKKNGKNDEVYLKKEKINVEDNIIQSFILEGKQKVGYIYLPSFYTQMDNPEALLGGCANDIAKELIKLKKEGITSLIFDLRNNGGGVMLEAMQLAGIFIDYGALGIMHTKDQEPSTLKDLNRGTIYNEPVIILINSLSASASEFFAAALQDHNRALIVGSKSFGKSTAQDIIPIDAYKYDINTKMNEKPEGFIKLTMSKFYRATGKSHQNEGVVPDIELPDLYDKLDIAERNYKNALPNTNIDKKTYFFPFPALPIEELKKLSQTRIKNDTNFSDVIKYSENIAKQQNKFTIPLQFDKFKKFFNSESNETENTTKISNNDLYKVKNQNYIKGISSIYNSSVEINEDAMKQIYDDIYIKESYQILNDLMTITKK